VALAYLAIVEVTKHIFYRVIRHMARWLLRPLVCIAGLIQTYRNVERVVFAAHAGFLDTGTSVGSAECPPLLFHFDNKQCDILGIFAA